MASTGVVLSLVLLASVTIGVFANDPDMLQDVCVADLPSATRVNGFTCKNIDQITAEDFFFAGIGQPGQITNNILRSKVTGANVQDIPGLNTLGVSMARVDFAPYGLNPPHIHPRATEMIFVLQGELLVGFITTNNKLISKVVKTGETFVFPRGLGHFQKNLSKYPAAVLAAFNSQLPGTQQFAAALFTSQPPVPNDVLAQAFNIDVKNVENIRAGLSS
ncbi:germin-like protein subfamily 2 member 4 [Amaranthus tricolor]|uniref:germin-like protein subfamily 2 member 4 n=1 Tax=Amaranthus tricolor TaxID=29722 RepID=UPI00258EED9E|nr:germin-like protein subfamily 2 member 4 [Amaranthus tricolor]XP_057547208.1 germin-like protein subfamily 2 member 4 [Amaranthus tricolor]